MSLTPALFTSPKVDGTDPTKLRPSNWNRIVSLINSLLDGADAAGGILLRDPTDVTDGAIWLPAVAAGAYLRSAGVGAAPAWSALTLPNAATQGDLVIATGANVLGSLADVAAGSVLVSGGVGAAPAWSAAPTVTRVLVGDGTASAPSVAFSSETNTGFRWAGANTVVFDQAGTDVLQLGGGVGVVLHSNHSLKWGASGMSTPDTALARGGAAGKITLTGTTPMLQVGGTTSSFPALKRNGTVLESRLADDSAYASFTALNHAFTGGIYVSGTTLLISATAPTIASGFGTSPSIPNQNGPAAFTVNVGTGGTANSGVITLPAATNGWICHVTNLTAVAANRADQATRQTASTTTSVTVQNQTLSTGAALAWTAGDVLRVSCFAY